MKAEDEMKEMKEWSEGEREEGEDGEEGEGRKRAEAARQTATRPRRLGDVRGDVTLHLTKLKRHPMFQNTRFRLYCLAAARSVLAKDWMGDGQVERGRCAEGQDVCAREIELGLVR